jgi:NCAIR mutase (PurE)-related protein
MDKANTKESVLQLLKSVEAGKISAQDALHSLQIAPFEDLGYANIDYHRGIRQGIGEVIYGKNKTDEQIKGITSKMIEKGFEDILITRISQKTADFLLKESIDLQYYPIASLAVARRSKKEMKGLIVIASGGTSDMPICEEAAITAEVLGNRVERLYDVGVAGLHRLLSKKSLLVQARAIIAIAGMEGALATVIGGLVSCPIIAVPTSVGYGANFGGLSALLSMLNSCANGVSVVNIDNGFGAGYIANLINKMESAK